MEVSLECAVNAMEDLGMRKMLQDYLSGNGNAYMETALSEL
jgi:hypothetical protein